MWSFFFGWLTQWIAANAVPVTKIILKGLGIGFVSFVGMDLLLDWMKDYLVGVMMGLPSYILGMVGYVGVPKALSILFSAVAIRMMLDGVRNGRLIQRPWSPPGADNLPA